MIKLFRCVVVRRDGEYHSYGVHQSWNRLRHCDLHECISYYRATHTHSAVFGMVQRLSVCLSVCHKPCFIETGECIELDFGTQTTLVL